MARLHIVHMQFPSYAYAFYDTAQYHIVEPGANWLQTCRIKAIVKRCLISDYMFPRSRGGKWFVHRWTMRCRRGTAFGPGQPHASIVIGAKSHPSCAQGLSYFVALLCSLRLRNDLALSRL